MKTIDLHVHTNYSDGVHSVEEIFELAKKAGITTIAIADHNWPHHIANNAVIAEKFKINFIQGIEISALFENTTVHILGYSKKFDLDKLCRGLNKQIDGFNKRSELIVNSINESGVAKISFEDMKKNFKGCIQNFPVMIELGRALKSKPLEEPAKSIYKRHSVPYGDWLMGPVEVVKLIHDSNGIAVLAHPAVHWRKAGRDQFDRLFKVLLESGIDGLEASHSEQNDQEEKEIIKLAHDNNLLVTGGSDFHGLDIHPDRKLTSKGMSEKELKILKEKLEA